MTIWTMEPDLDRINKMADNTLVEVLGIQFVEAGPDYLKAVMPVDHRTHQPFGMLHGGASVALAETMGSVGALHCVNPETHFCVGLEINANHVRSVRSGIVTGLAEPLHVGRTTHLWEIRITDSADRLVCVSRLTMAVLARGKDR
ncbi:MAG: hotdog fold thioesterase [Thermodesulfobacteriota bacterium]